MSTENEQQDTNNKATPVENGTYVFMNIVNFCS